MIPYTRAMWASEIDRKIPLAHLNGVSFNRAIPNVTTTTHSSCDFAHFELCQIGVQLDRAIEQAYHEIESLFGGGTLYPIQRHELHPVRGMGLANYDVLKTRHDARGVGTLRIKQVGTVAVNYTGVTDKVILFWEMSKADLFERGFYRLRFSDVDSLYDPQMFAWSVSEWGGAKWGVPHFVDADTAYHPSQDWIAPIEVGVRQKTGDATKVTIEVRVAKGLLVLPTYRNECVDPSVVADIYADEVALEYVYIDPRETPIGVIGACSPNESPMDLPVERWLTGRVEGDGERVKVLPYTYTYADETWTGATSYVPMVGTYVVNYVSGLFPMENGMMPPLYKRLVAMLATHYLMTVEGISVAVCGNGCRWDALHKLLLPPLFRTMAVTNLTNERYTRNPNEGNNGTETNRRPANHAYGDTLAGDVFYNLLKQVPEMYQYASLGRFDGVTVL